MEHTSGHQEQEHLLAMDEPQAWQLNHHLWSTLLPLLQEHQVAVRADLASSLSLHTTIIVTNPKPFHISLEGAYIVLLFFCFLLGWSYPVFSGCQELVNLGLLLLRLLKKGGNAERSKRRSVVQKVSFQFTNLLLFQVLLLFLGLLRSFGFNGSSLSSRVFLGVCFLKFPLKLVTVVAKIVTRRLKSFLV